MVESLRRTFHQNTERIEEIWKEYKKTVEHLANSVRKRIDVVPNHVNKRVIDLSKNLSRELCRNCKKNGGFNSYIVRRFGGKIITENQYMIVG
jgi:RNase P subunit RPR2